MAFVLTGAFLLWRAPHWHLARPYLVATVAWGCFYSNYYLPVHPLQVLAFVSASGLAVGLTSWCAHAWNESVRPGRGALALSCALGLGVFVSMAASYLGTLPAGTAPYSTASALGVAFIALYLGAIARAHRQSEALERRRARWLLCGHFVGFVPVGILIVAREALPTLPPELFSLAFLPLAAIPLSFAVAIVGYGWLDVDRLISASAAATVVGVALVGGLLAVVPPLASAASTTLGVAPGTSQLALSMGLAAVLVPAYRRLRPWLDRRLFAEQHALAARFEALRTEPGASRGVEEMATRAGKGFEALLKPESVAIYGRAGERRHAALPAREGAAARLRGEQHAGAGARGEARAALRAEQGARPLRARGARDARCGGGGAALARDAGDRLHLARRQALGGHLHDERSRAAGLGATCRGRWRTACWRATRSSRPSAR
jgi:hypothetical protein